MEQQHELTPEEFKKMMQAKEQAAFSLLTAQTTRIMTNEDEFLDFLNKLADHVTTSVGNTILVQAQLPNATAVLSIKEWEKRNVSVIKDANGYYPEGIYQFAPNGQRVDENGEVHTKFKLYKGYDACQTTNPEYARSVMNNARPISVFIGSNNPEKTRNIALCNSSPIRCIVYDPKQLIHTAEDISEKDELKYIPETKTVIIRKVARQEWFQRVAYEIALGIFHKQEGSMFDRSSRSFEAGIVSYLLCRSVGVDTSAFSFDLSGLPKRYPEQTSFRSMMETCQEIAHDLAYRLNNKLREQNTRNCAGDNRHLHFAKEG